MGTAPPTHTGLIVFKTKHLIRVTLLVPAAAAWGWGWGTGCRTANRASEGSERACGPSRSALLRLPWGALPADQTTLPSVCSPPPHGSPGSRPPSIRAPPPPPNCCRGWRSGPGWLGGQGHASQISLLEISRRDKPLGGRLCWHVLSHPSCSRQHRWRPGPVTSAGTPGRPLARLQLPGRPASTSSSGPCSRTSRGSHDLQSERQHGAMAGTPARLHPHCGPAPPMPLGLQPTCTFVRPRVGPACPTLAPALPAAHRSNFSASFLSSEATLANATSSGKAAQVPTAGALCLPHMLGLHLPLLPAPPATWPNHSGNPR